MTIRFQCASCSQPIEIDDEWASKTVACPYCRKTVTAPPESTLGEPDQIPMATPFAVDTPTAEPLVPPEYGASPRAGQNRIAMVALVLAGCSIGMLLVGRGILGSHRLELEELQKIMSASNDWAKNMEAQNEFLQENPNTVTWLVPAALLLLGAVLTSVAAIICGIIGVRRHNRRRLAATGIAIGGASLIFSCCGGLIF